MDPVTIAVACGLGVLILGLVAAQIVSTARRGKAARQLLAADPYTPLIFTQLGSNMKAALKESVGAQGQLQVTSVDGKAAPFMVTPDGRFTPTTPGRHQVKLMAVRMVPGLARRITTGELTLDLERGQRVLIEIDTSTDQWRVRGL